MASIKDDLKKGDEITKFIQHITHYFPSVKEFNFIRYQPSAGVEDRISNATVAENIVWFAEKKWQFEKDLIKNFDQPNGQQQKIEKLLSHNFSESDNLVPVKKNQLAKWLADNRQPANGLTTLGISSRCKMSNGAIMHIPMMDFSCPLNSNFTKLIKQSLAIMNQQNGILADSGKSYHFYGTQLLSASDWMQFMSRCILLGPFTDIRYIAHRMLSGYSTLRIGHTVTKPKVPEIIETFINSQ